MYGVEIWGMGDGIDGVQGRFCKKVLRIPRCAASGIAEWESMRYKMLDLVVQYWCLIAEMGKDELIRGCYLKAGQEA